ncbi:C-type lectin domain family 6 member A-like [Pangasianodon hypophthalmus]|uniref:C-type lectin domain family 6 member A-like n=1 Tax=Pangasianodon hypophthalmus TaxID=310915 RepID=UPI000EFFD72F|nr:C-type lectin domain family 6 member A-like [Pangasianodon hypophthalmus]
MKYLVAGHFLVLLGALTAVCVLGILYHMEVFSNAILNEKYANVTAMMKVQVHKATELKSDLDEVQERYKTMLKQLDALKEKERLCGMFKEKYERIHELLIAHNASENCGICEEGWKAFGLKCYYFSTEKLNWTQSRDDCVENGSHLVIITSQSEQNFVSSHIKETHWIGLNDLETEGKWMWVNNQPLNETGVTFWYSEGPKQPDNWKNQDPSGENCAALGDANGNTHRWFDASCCTLKKWICEK